jgi:glycosyltransferase involved in cell wall biosynthesis
MTVSIIIRTKNEERSIGHVLKSIASQKINRDYEIIIIDSGSSDRTLEIVKEYDVRIFNIPSSKFSYGYSLNYGISHSSGDIVCSLSAHTIPYNDRWLFELISPIHEGKAHATYGRQIPVSGINPFEEVILQKHFPPNERRVGRVTFSNANSAFIRKMWDEVKFDERIPSWEDYLWYQLLKDRFVFQYTQNACVLHSHPFSMNAIAKIAYRDGRAIRYMKENYSVDVLENASSLAGKCRYVLRDVSSHSVFLLKKGYVGSMFVLPFVKVFSYLNYWRGYRSSCIDIQR